MSFSPDVEATRPTAETRFSAGLGAPAKDEAAAPSRHDALRLEAFQLGEKGLAARHAGDETKAELFFQSAVSTGLRALDDDPAGSQDLAPHIAEWALNYGDVSTAQRLMAGQSDRVAGPPAESWSRIADVEAWPDAWLVAAVRRSPPDEAALDVLAVRYWKVLYARCQLLAMNREIAADLAQDTWCRVLRHRERLRPGGNFRAYLLTIATNLWRDVQRAELRAGSLAESRLASIDRETDPHEGPRTTLAELLPDLQQLEAAERDRLKRDIDHALQRLSALSRDVLVARFLDDESCATIGRRYGRTEQTASGWVRHALAELKLCLENERRGAPSSRNYEDGSSR